MVNKTNYENINSKKDLLNTKYKDLNLLQAEIYLLKEDIRKTCKHDLLLVYNIVYDNTIFDYEKYRMACCLVCDDNIKLEYTNYLGYLSNEEEYIRYATKEVINNDNILDVTKFIPEEHRNYYVSGKNELIIEAQAVLDEVMLSNPNISNDELKKLIKERLINFSKEIENSLKKVYKKDK